MKVVEQNPPDFYFNRIVKNELKLKIIFMGTMNNYAFKASNGKYVTVSDDGTLDVNGTKPGTKGLFELIDQGNNSVALKAANGKYVSNRDEGAKTLAAVADKVADSEKFILNDWGVQQEFVLQANNQNSFNW